MEPVGCQMESFIPLLSMFGPVGFDDPFQHSKLHVPKFNEGQNEPV